MGCGRGYWRVKMDVVEEEEEKEDGTGQVLSMPVGIDS